MSFISSIFIFKGYNYIYIVFIKLSIKSNSIPKIFFIYILLKICSHLIKHHVMLYFSLKYLFKCLLYQCFLYNLINTIIFYINTLFIKYELAIDNGFK